MKHPDVLIVGGGVIGFAVAHELARRGLAVQLLDKDLPGRATSASAGGLWPVGEAVGLGCGVIYQATQAAARQATGELAAGEECHDGILPAPFRDLLVASNALFPALARELQESAGIDIEFRVGGGLIFAVYEPREQEYVDRVTQALPASCRLEQLTPEEAWKIEPLLTREIQGAALLSGEHQVNPMLLAEGFKRAALRQGAEFHHDTRVTALRRVGERIVGVEAEGEFFPAGTVVNAAGAWSGELARTAGLHCPVFPVRGQIVLTQALPRAMNACLSTSGCYIAQKLHGEVLIGSTTERVGFDVDVTPEGIAGLCKGAVRALPLVRYVHIKRVWAGLRPGTSDELPILGPAPGIQGYVNATGAFRTGIVAAPLTARLVAQSLLGEPTDQPIEPFLAARFGAPEPAPAA
ncbi:MAG TPA: FAD-dependent oxidoreductase [Planctomycetota bacterium]